jgi:hypothetical protein
MNASYAGFAAGLLVLPVMLTWMTSWQRQGTTFFGVTVEAGFGRSPEASRILRQFHWRLWALAAGVTVLLVGFPRVQNLNFTVGLIALYAVGLTMLFRQSWKQAQAYASTAPRVRSVTLREAASPLSPGGKRLVRVLSVAGLILPIAMMAATLWFLQAHLGQIPAHFPVRWTEAGVARMWAPADAMHLYGKLMASGVLYLGILFLLYAFEFRSRASDWAGMPGVGANYQQGMRFWLLAICNLSTAMLCVDALLPVYGNQPLPGVHQTVDTLQLAILVLLDVLMLAVVGLIYWARKRYGVALDTTPDACWKLGQFYWNGNDPALLVPKRCGVGYTLNFGHGTTWAFLLLTVAMIAVPLWLGHSR